jgi:hypothetical protein
MWKREDRRCLPHAGHPEATLVTPVRVPTETGPLTPPRIIEAEHVTRLVVDVPDLLIDRAGVLRVAGCIHHVVLGSRWGHRQPGEDDRGG